MKEYNQDNHKEATQPSGAPNSRKGKPFGIFSFFSGAGFLDLGFEKAGFIPLMANEIDKNFSRVFEYSHERMGCPLPKYGLQTGDICLYLDDTERRGEFEGYLAEAKGGCSYVGFIGGPPCPDFSVAGKQAGAAGRHGRLSQIYIDLICAERPDFFVFENVKGLWKTAKHRAFFDGIVKQTQDAGYAVDYRLINALEYGAPQDRERIIFIGIKTALCRNHYDETAKRITGFPWMAHAKYSMQEVRGMNWPGTEAFVAGAERPMPSGIAPELTVQHWFDRNDVTHHPNGGDYFIPRAGLTKMQTFAEGDDSRKCYKRLHRWRYSPTAAYGNNEVHLHPYRARRLSVAEALAIQSLPKEFALPPDIPLSAKFKTIGNGVPFVAALGIAKTLKQFLREISE